jgi:hypothetical protein
MKNSATKFVMALVILSLAALSVLAQDSSAATTVDSEAAGGLDLHAVAELFKDAENLEKFEHALNDSETGVNNLDLNKDDHVDFIRVTEKVADDTHLIVLQALLGEDEFQDVATIAVEREPGEKYNLQVQGDTVIYGANYYVVPANNNFSAWNIVRGLFRPNYHPYVSTFSYRVLPSWWVARRPVLLSAYRTRTGLFVGRRNNFVKSGTLTVRTLNRVNYRPRTSTLVVRRPNATRTTTTTVVKPRTVVQTRTETTVRPRGVTQTTTTNTRRDAPPRRGRH